MSVYVDAVWVNLAIFAVGQLFAWRYAHSGRFWVGAGVTVLLWTSLDWWLVGRYLLAYAPEQQALPLAGLQLTAAATAFAFLWACVRRRRGRHQRDAGHRQALACLLRGDHAGATEAYRGLVWSDGWDAAAWIGLGDAYRRSGARGKAARSYRRAGAVDVSGQLADVLDHRGRLLEAWTEPVGTVPVAAEAAAAPKGRAKARSAG